MSENRLKDETSPYLLQHKDNPVHWRPWGPEALAEAERTGKPILLSVGYAACHWCHVMAHESFEDHDTAAVMNDHFVNIKVDREERPDIDAIYMGALHRLGEQGGWPMTMFLDSKGRPFWGGTYFPKQPMYGRPAFVTVLLRLAEAYQNQPKNVSNNADMLIASLLEETQLPAGPWISEDQIAELVSRIEGAVDAVHGGLNGAPKFPQWSVFWLLWRGGIRFDNVAARDAVITTLTHICQGGIYDHLGGGFARYSVDEKWLVPHFEKMLYDNALLIDLMTEVWRETQNELLAERIAETVAWLRREMIAEGGGFAASLDADSEGEEGKFYVWTEAEIMDALGQDDGSFFCGMYGVTPDGNFEGKTILNRLDQLMRGKAEDEARLKALRDKLLAVRGKRVRPGWDDKVLADWNGLMIAALARAATVFKKPEWLQLAQQAFDFVSNEMALGQDRLWHSSRDGELRAPAVASDYANMTWAAIRLLEATGDERYLKRAIAWAKTMATHYWDENVGGYYSSADDTEDVVVRLKPAIDDAQPSANAIQLWNLIALEALTGDIQHGTKADALLGAYSTPVAQSPFAHCGLIAASLDRNSLVQISVPSGTDEAFLDAANSMSLPGAVILEHADKVGFHAAFNDENVGLSQAYVCQGQTCQAPSSSASEFKAQLEVSRRATISKL